MSRKIIYWLLPVFGIAYYGLLRIIPKTDFYDQSFWFLILLPHYLLFLFSYTMGQQIFELPKPSVKRAIFAALAAVVLIPLFYLIVFITNTLEFWGDYNEQLEPICTLCINLAFFLSVLTTLRILGLRPPRGKCLLMCFLPVLLFAALGTVLILILDTGFWVYHNSFNSLPIDQRNHMEIVSDYFNAFELYSPFVTSSFTLYWTMKYHHKQAEKAAAPALASPDGKLSA